LNLLCKNNFLISELIQEGITDPTATLSVSPQGIQTMVLRGDEGSEFIEKNPENSSLYMIFSGKVELRVVCP
jgi:hypothetical protein